MSRGLHEGLTRSGDAGFSLFVREELIMSAVYVDDTRDVEGRRVDLLVDEAERAAVLPASERPAWASRCYARRFHDTVMQADEGCDFEFLHR